MSKTSLGKYKRPSKNSKLYKKSKKIIPTRNNFVIVFASKFRCSNPHATWGTEGGDIWTSSVTCCTTCKEESWVAGSTFDVGWGTRWWQDVDGGAENKKWVVVVGEDGKVGLHGDVTVDRSWTGYVRWWLKLFWYDCGVSVEADAEAGEVMSLVGLADGIWSEVVLSDEEKSWWKGGYAVNVCDFGGTVREFCKIIWRFGLKGVAVADSDWGKDDWESGWTKRRFDLGKKHGGGDLINDDCDKYDDDDCDDCGDNTSCNVSIINFENLMFLFSIRWRRSL